MTFEEQFPSLKDKVDYGDIESKSTWSVSYIDIEKHTIDKQRLREVFDKYMLNGSESNHQRAISGWHHCAKLIKEELGL